MSQTGLRRTRDKLLFALAYGAVIAAVLFLHPVPDARDAGKLAANVETGAAARRPGTGRIGAGRAFCRKAGGAGLRPSVPPALGGGEMTKRIC